MRYGTILAAAIVLTASAFAGAQSVTSGYAPVNGLNMYYEIRGTGEPLVLLHGGLGSLEMFGPNLEALSRNRQVIAADLQGHGRTADIDRPLSYELMADDVSALIKYLGFQKADVMGYSLGGAVALQTAIQHPEVVRKLVLVSTAFQQHGWYPEILAAEAQMGPAIADQMKQTPVYQAWASLAPRPQDWPGLLGKLGTLLKQDYDWSKGVAELRMPVLIVGADADAVRTAHTLEFFGMFGGGKRDAGWDGSGRPSAELAILPGTSHYTIFSTPALAAAVAPFLDAPITRAME